MENIKATFFGHKYIPFDFILNRLFEAVENELKLGCREFLVSSHSTIDFFAPYVCLSHINEYRGIKLIVQSADRKLSAQPRLTTNPYDDPDRFYDEYNSPYPLYCKNYFENYKPLIDAADIAICYVDRTKTEEFGPKYALEYAKQRNMKIVNLFHDEDKLKYGKYLIDKKEKSGQLSILKHMFKDF